MYTCAPSEVIHGRSLPARSMICAVQLLRLKPGKVAPGHVIAETEIRARRNGLLIGTTSVVAWSAPVEPTSTSASPPPNTTAKPALVSALSIAPCRVGVEPKLPVHSCVPKGKSHPNDVIAIKSPLKAISGSLLPFGNSRGVLEKLGSPGRRGCNGRHRYQYDHNQRNAHGLLHLLEHLPSIPRAILASDGGLSSSQGVTGVTWR